MVALRKESVDRNRAPHHKNTRPMVALRKESVDRNNNNNYVVTRGNESLSARRAWIEISKIWYCGTSIGVALRKESVDRNYRLYY